MIILLFTDDTQNLAMMPNSGPQPVIALLDMDCFYVQVEARERPDLKGRPAAVVQYNSWKGGGIIAVNYEARAQGVSRNMRGDQAREKCPEIELVMVPVIREKANLSKYRKAGREVIEVTTTVSDPKVYPLIAFVIRFSLTAGPL